MDTSDLLKQLRIDRAARVSRSRARTFALAGAVLLALAGGLVWLVLARAAPPVVRTAVARPAGPTAEGGSILDASGYVTARRQATVSAKITGKVVAVLIEEGMRVEEGAVLARLDDTEAKARAAASSEGVSLSKWVAERIERGARAEWPAFVRELAGAWRDLPSAEQLRKAKAKDVPRGRL